MRVTSCLLCGRWDGEQLLEVHRGEHMLKAETRGEQAQCTPSTCPGCVSSDLHLVTDNEALEIQCYVIDVENMTFSHSIKCLLSKLRPDIDP